MKRTMGVLSLIVFLLTLSTFTRSVSFQDNQWARNVRRQLRAQASTLADYDVVPSHEVLVDTLNTGYYKDINYELEAGVRYIFVGACDQDCTDLDLKLFDDNGNLVASDMEPDAYPYFSITVRRSTTFHLRVLMETCLDDPCWWGVGAYKPERD